MKLHVRPFLIVAALAAAFFMAPARAQQACGPRPDIVKRLADVYRESRRAAGIAANGDLIEIFVAEAGTWTIMVTRPGGPSCVVAVGDHWQRDAVTKPRGGAT